MAAARLPNQPNAHQPVSLHYSMNEDMITDPTLMTNSEAFVETLRSRRVSDCFGIVGSAFMDALDLFPSAGIRFISVQHEQNAVHMADGYARVSNKHGVCIGQNGNRALRPMIYLTTRNAPQITALSVQQVPASPTSLRGCMRRTGRIPL